jgi:hypothetical protein
VFARHVTTRRAFLGMAALGSAALALDVRALAQAVLPAGPSPEPVPLPHFPSRLHAFVWRNWPLVPAATLAKAISATTDQIVALAESMSLGPQPAISPQQLQRTAITIIKRNWHLLPYEQLLTLLGWTAEQLAYALREDDFLYVKLGNLKPKCPPIRYSQPADASRTAEIIAQQFPKKGRPEPLFSFLTELSRKSNSKSPSHAGLRLCYSYFALYGDPLLDPALDPYPDGYLAKLAASGVNAVWLQGVLQKLSPFPWDMERSRDYEIRLQNLRQLARRAGRHGIRVFLYLNEPRALSADFFIKHPHLKGATEGEFSTLCTSAPEVQEYLTNSVASICRAVPELGGFFTITASENLTNCWSHNNGAQCPRCGKRQPAEVIAEVNSALHRGIVHAKTSAELLVWDWGWSDSWAPDAINRLPAGVSLVSVSEWSLPIDRGGIKSTVGEYSISSIGPGPRASRHWQAARKRGLRAIAKIQAANTWELSAIPYIPAMQNVAQHALNLRNAGIKDVMLGWTLGGYPSPNIEVVGALLNSEDDSVDSAMRKVAERLYGKKFASAVVEAWRQVSAAFSEFPYHGGVVYSAPLQLGPANLLWETSTGYRASMVGFPYDDLDTWRSIYPADVFIGQMDKVARGFYKAASDLKALSQPPAELQLETGLIEAAAIHFRSTANQARFVQARRRLSEAKTSENAARELSTLSEIIQGEMELAQRLHALQSRDPRIGFEASNQYYYIPIDLMEKVLNCRDLLDRWIPAQRARWKIS